MTVRRCLACLGTLLLTACGASITTSGRVDAPIPGSSTLAVVPLYHADPGIANAATLALESAVTGACRHDFTVIDHEAVVARLDSAGIGVPRDINRPFLQKFASAVDADYLLTGGITEWHKGGVGFSGARTKVSLTLSVYDIAAGGFLLSATGDKDGGGGIFAGEPASTAEDLFGEMLRKIPALLCE